MTEEQFEALKKWIEAIALDAVVEDRPMHRRAAKYDRISVPESEARRLLIEEES